jgi:hypothetical protein
MKKTPPKEFSIMKKYPPDTLNTKTIKTLGNTDATIEVFPPEIFFKGKLPSIDLNLWFHIRY